MSSSRRSPRSARGGSWRSAAARASSPSGWHASCTPRLWRSISRSEWWSSRGPAEWRRTSATCKTSASQAAPSTAPSPPGCCFTLPTSIERSPSLLVYFGRADASWRRRTGATTCASSTASSGGNRLPRPSTRRTVPSPSAATSRGSTGLTSTAGSSFRMRAAAQAYVDSMVVLSGTVPPVEGPIRARRTPCVFVADK